MTLEMGLILAVVLLGFIVFITSISCLVYWVIVRITFRGVRR